MRTAALLRRPTTSAIDEDVAHRDRRDAEEVRAIAPVGALRSRELEIELVHERGRGQRVARTHRELAPRGASELVIDERKNLIERFASARPKIPSSSVMLVVWSVGASERSIAGSCFSIAGKDKTST